MKKLLFLLFAICASVQAENLHAFERIPDRAELEILSPTLAQRQTAKLRLRNGLEVYLISDPEVKQSAAALAVEAGSWDNPVEYPGMAHFLEHMLFMGTAAYPDEGEYMKYIFENGGLVNAYTAEDRTVYMFSVNNEAFKGALDRFSHFFIDPLFQQSSINRELHAVDQEHSKNIEHDGIRQFMVFKETGNPNHPNVGFSCGNADTLRGIPQDEMKKWYREHYSAHKMHLVVTSSLPIDDLIEATVNDFSAVLNNHIETTPYPPHMFSENQRGNILYIKPVKDLKVLSMIWELPTDLATDQEGQIGTLLSYILSNGSKNSLLGLLKRQHLAKAIQVGEDSLSKTNKLFAVEIELSDKGIEQVNTVITYFFETLARLKKTGIPRYVFNEVQKISEIQYQYQARTNAFDLVQKTAAELVYEDLSTFPRKTRIPTKFNPELTSNYIAYLTPENCIFSIMADPAKTQVTLNRQEKWMGAEYRVVPVLQKQLQAWTQVAINPQIGLPLPNSFIPSNMTLVSSTFSDETVIPSLLQDNDQGKVYFAEDHRYLTPKVTHLFRIKSPLLDGSAQAKAFADLYAKALEDQLFPITSAAELAGSSVLIKPDNLSLAIALDSYSEPSTKLVEDIFSGIKKPHFSKEQFELFKKSVVSDYENTTKELPVLQSIEVMNSIIFNDAPMSNEKLKAARNITYEEFLDFSHDLIKKTYIEGLLYGNITRTDAEALLSTIKKKIKSESYPVKEHHQRRVLTLPDGQGPYMIAQSTPMLGNAVMLMVEQGSYSFEKRAAQQVLGNVLKTSFWDTLRTKQQTAYIAKAWEKEEERQLMQFFVVQSSTHQPNELIVRFELFLENFIKQYITEFPPERFDNVRRMAIASLQMPPENLLLMGARLFQLAFDFDGDFHLVSKRIAALEKLTYDETRKVAEETLSRKNSKRIAILLEGMTPKEKDFRYELITKENLLHQGTFVAWK